MHLFHGTSILLNKLTALPHIFATSDINRAVLYSAFQYTQSPFKHFFISSNLVMERHKNAFDILKCPGYVYIVSNNNFAPCNESDYISYRNPKIIRIYKINNVFEYLRNSDVELKKFKPISMIG